MARALRSVAERLAELATLRGEPLHALQRLHTLEGVLRRVSQLPDRETLVLRGSLMTRLWAQPARRTADDVDFVTTFAFDRNRAVELLRTALALPDGDDGVCFSVDLLHSAATWVETPFPGIRVTVPACVGEVCHEVQIDLGFADPLVPAAEWLEYPALRPEWNTTVRACRPELGCAWKIHGLFEQRNWRKKDLYDISLILGHRPLDLAVLQEAVRVAFESRCTPLGTVRRLVQGDFGSSQGSLKSWRRFRRDQGDPAIPEDHREEVRFVADRVRPMWTALREEQGS